ncbi:MAG: ABC transporter substrate-binding protein [Selenomonadaceae bacterium]|nr:ABC transporter substrate-binding protein [Selenomonadaceae bacterium]
MKNIFAFALILALIFTGCGDNSAAVTSSTSFAVIQDDAGREVALAEKPARIVVTSASFLEPLHRLGANIVGRPDSKNNMPDWAEDISSVGQVYQIDVERLLACQPDLVIVNKGMNERLLDVLAENKIPALVTEMKTFDNTTHALRTFAQVTGETAAAEEIIAQMNADIQKTVASIPHEKKCVAILHSTAQGLSVQLEGSIAGCIVEMLGWENVAAGMTPLENNPDAAPYSMETLAAQNPEIIFVTSMGNLDSIRKNMQETIDSNDAWQAIGAVKNNQLYYLPQNFFLLSPGLNYPEAVELVAKLIYPAS